MAATDGYRIFIVQALGNGGFPERPWWTLRIPAPTATHAEAEARQKKAGWSGPLRVKLQPCGCENTHCDHGSEAEWHACTRPAISGFRVLHIGEVCEECYARYPAQYRVVRVAP